MLIRIVANGDDIIERNVAVLVHVVGRMTRNIDAILLHDGNRPRINTVDFDACTENVCFSAGKLTQVAFCDLTSTTVARYKGPGYFSHQQPDQVDSTEFRIKAKDELQDDQGSCYDNRFFVFQPAILHLQHSVPQHDFDFSA